MCSILIILWLKFNFNNMKWFSNNYGYFDNIEDSVMFGREGERRNQWSLQPFPGFYFVIQ